MGIALASAAKKAIASFGRRFGVLEIAEGWETKAAMCERCHLRVLKCGVSYCGKPYLSQIDRKPAIDGCGCPCHEKAKTPGEHCPLDLRHLPAIRHGENCTCKWCSISQS